MSDHDHEGPRRDRSNRIRVLVDHPVPTTPLADRAWSRAGAMRRGRALVCVGLIALLGCIAVIGPRPPAPRQLPDPARTVAVPAGVRVLPAFGELAKLPRRTTVLPARINPISTVDLSDRPVRRAVAVLRTGSGPLVVVADDATTRSVSGSKLAGGQLLATSLSPDGTRVALVAAVGLLVIDLSSGAVRSVAAQALQPNSPALAWRSARTVLLPHGADSIAVNVDTGAVTAVAGVNGLDAVNTRGPAPDGMRELVPASASITLPPRIRAWHANGVEYEDRPIFGPSWIGNWSGAGWSTQDIMVRPCSSGEIALPGGRARAAVGAVNANGLYAATLVSAEFTTVDILGFADPGTVLVGAYSPTETDILAWSPHVGTVQLVTTVSGYVRLSVADLLVAIP